MDNAAGCFCGKIYPSRTGVEEFKVLNYCVLGLVVVHFLLFCL